MKMTRALFLSVMLCAFGIHSVAFATPESQPPTVEHRKAAQKMFEAGDALYEAGRYEEAAEAFRQSHSLVKSPNSRLMFARSLRELGKTEEACVEYRGTRDDATESGGRYPEALQAATAELSALESQSRTPAAATPKAAAPPVAISAVDAKPARESSALPAPQSPNPLRTAAWISAGVGAAGAVGFVVFGLLDRNTYDDLEKDCPSGACSGDPSGRIDSGRAYQLTANVGAGLALLGAVTATTLFIVSAPKSSNGPGTAVLLAPGSVQVQGHF
jgi:tetratricopeptide (TPR) repeat protein